MLALKERVCPYKAVKLVLFRVREKSVGGKKQKSCGKKAIVDTQNLRRRGYKTWLISWTEEISQLCVVS